jgi:molecular chaperone DnaJ
MSLVGDLFGAGTGRRRTGPQAGSDLRYNLRITFQEAVSGVEKEVEVEKLETCTVCQGEGAEPGTQRTTCPTCQGRGQVHRTQGFLPSAPPVVVVAGREPLLNCLVANAMAPGSRRKKKLALKIPSGVDTGARLRLQGEGEGGLRGGPARDLYVFIDVEQTPFSNAMATIFIAKSKFHLPRRPWERKFRCRA